MNNIYNVRFDRLTLKGGASKGLIYFRLLKELWNKNITFRRLSGSSAGGIFVAIIACVRNPFKAFKILMAIIGDVVMKWVCSAEQGKDSDTGKKLKPIQRVLRGLGMLVFKFIPMGSMKRAFKKYLKWKYLKKNGVEELYIVIAIIIVVVIITIVAVLRVALRRKQRELPSQDKHRSQQKGASLTPDDSAQPPPHRS